MRESSPASRAGESGGRDTGKLSSEMMVTAQYAPLRWQRNVSRDLASCASCTYRTSSSPPSHTRKPPSACFNRPSHCHLGTGQTHVHLTP